MPIFNVLNYQELVSLAAGEPGGQINLTGLEQTFLINLLAGILWTESQACHAIWTDKASLNASQKDAAGALIDGTIHKLMMDSADECQSQIGALNLVIEDLQAQIVALNGQISAWINEVNTLTQANDDLQYNYDQCVIQSGELEVIIEQKTAQIGTLQGESQYFEDLASTYYFELQECREGCY